MTSAESEPHFRSADLLSPERSCLLVIDVQEKLLPVIRDGASVRDSIRFLLDVAEILHVPAILSEQYPQGLGRTVDPVHGHAAFQAGFEKIRFSAAHDLQNLLRHSPPENLRDRDQFVVCGIEAHVCVQQTALDLLAAGYRVCVVADAMGSRRQMDCHTALQRLRDSGCAVTTCEAVAFEWCEQAGTDTFRSISRLVRQRDVETR